MLYTLGFRLFLPYFTTDAVGLSFESGVHFQNKATGKKDKLFWDLRCYYWCYFIIEVICLCPDFVYAFNFLNGLNKAGASQKPRKSRGQGMENLILSLRTNGLNVASLILLLWNGKMSKGP